MSGHRTARAQMAGVAGKTSADHNAEIPHPQCFADGRHQAVRFQTRGFQIFSQTQAREAPLPSATYVQFHSIISRMMRLGEARHVLCLIACIACPVIY